MQNPRSRDFSLNRLNSVPGPVPNVYPPSVGGGLNQGPSWTDSLPRRDFYNMAPGNTGSLPRRDKAGLGRPEPQQVSNGGRKVGRDSSLGREPGFVGVKASFEKRNSTGNLYFTDALEDSSGMPQRPLSRQSVKSVTGCVSSSSVSAEEGVVSKELKTAAGKVQPNIYRTFLFQFQLLILGDLGKELKNLISMMDREEAEEAAAAAAAKARPMFRMTPSKSKKQTKL